MADGLAYFTQVYGDVPGWVKKMHDYSPQMLDYYTDFRGEAFKENELSKKEKDQFIASANAGRLYDRSMMYHTKAAIGNGSTVEELVEYFLVAYLYKGTEALKLGLQATAYAAELLEREVAAPQLSEDASDQEIFGVLLSYVNEEEQAFLKSVIEAVGSGADKQQLEEIILSDGVIPASKKYLNMVSQYISELDGKGAAPWMERAREKGATEAELADVGYICILTAGIPAWFEISDSLIEE